MASDNKVLIWDWPVRVFHALLIVAFLGAFGIAKVLGEDSSAFPFHMMLGLTAGLLVKLRILYGFFGTRWARWGALDLSPGRLARYVADVPAGKESRSVGHNPATSWAMLAMFACVLGLALTGYLKTQGNEAFEDVHGFLAIALAVLAVLHVMGVAVHALRHRDGIALSMVHGRKEASDSDAIKSSMPLAGIALLGIVALFVGAMISSYNPGSSSFTVPVLNSRVQGETEVERGGIGEEEGEEREEDD